jgi:lincosamide nucleotidyltransferase A/C/D/E
MRVEGKDADMARTGRGRDPQAEMTAELALELAAHLEAAGVEVWLDGGWAVDALLGEQTRPHDDLDLVVCLEDMPRLERRLGALGYSVGYGAPPSSVELVDADGHQVDVHPFAADASGNGHYCMADGGTWVFPAHGFAGSGRILGRDVRCLTPDVVLVNHSTGYALDDAHRRDVRALAQRYGLPMPPAAAEPRTEGPPQRR